MNRLHDKCGECQRGPAYFEGCSRVECPKRRMVTAQVVGDPFACRPIGVLSGIAVNGGVRRKPTTKDE